MIHPFADLLERSRKPSRIVVGLMSGTSADSIDVAVCRMTGQGTEVGVELLHYREHPHDPEVKRRVIGIADLDVRGVAELNVMVGEAFAAACLATLEDAGISPDDVDLIGSHGQTVYHHSGMAGAIAGDAPGRRRRRDRGPDGVLCHLRFPRPRHRGRRRGCAALADRRHRAFRPERRTRTRRRRAILNLGGIANLTVLDDDPARVFGFDTGPANAPLDRLARRLSGGALACDRDGQFARSGRVNEPLLAELLRARPFPGTPPAQIDGLRDVRRCVRRPRRRASRRLRRRPDGHAHRVRRADGRLGHPPVRRSSVRPCEEVVAAGGGVKNPVLMERIAALSRRSRSGGPTNWASRPTPARPWPSPSWPT